MENSLDGVKEGWGSKYGPILQDLGLHKVEDAAEMREGEELQDLLQQPAGAQPQDIIQIVKSIRKAKLHGSGGSEVNGVVDAPEEMVVADAFLVTHDAYASYQHVDDAPVASAPLLQDMAMQRDSTFAVANGFLTVNPDPHLTLALTLTLTLTLS
jgi:hypothetical protein